MMQQTKDHYIEFLRKNGFNCFPIPEMQKVADFRFQARRTKLNQRIDEKENYGVIPIEGAGTAIIDFDNKELYRTFVESTMKAGFLVIETGKGWHIPITNLSGKISKIELFDYNVQQTKIIEIQGSDHYCVGAGSMIFHDKLNQYVTYQAKGEDKIWDAGGNDFHNFVDQLCKKLNINPRKQNYRSRYKDYRDRFLKGLPPTEGTSNDYFRMASLQCNTDGLTQNEALDKIRIVYDKWAVSKTFSKRPWSNIEAKIIEVYEKNEKIEKGKPKSENFDTTIIAQTMIKERKLYSDVDTDEIFENKSGFLEKINNILVREIAIDYPAITKENYNKILFTLKALAEPIPKTNRDLIVFKNGVYDHTVKRLIETDEIADMGFKDYNYLDDSPDNFPTKFHNVMYGNVPKEQHKRINAGLKAIFSNQLDPKISIIHGMSGIGKSTALAILTEILGDYALTVELKQFLADKFISAKIYGKHLLVFQDLPKEWKDFTVLKTITGEPRKTERGFMQDSITFENKVKIWATGNYLAIIPDEEKDAMYTRRLSLINNIRTEAYKEDPSLIKKIIEKEAEKIVSWIINLPESECQYEDKVVLAKEWERIASPEILYLEKYWQLSSEPKDTSIMEVVNDCRDKTKTNVSIQQMLKSLRGLGYVIKYNIIKNMEIKPQRIVKQSLQSFDGESNN